ncbi:MAG TPA: aminoglycoside phosphotransferase family protein [Vicinamibacterales bacterium]|nr:aminoglycoside phosphotransferase family protein [Vicinamibacterales bacterium]
MDLVLPARLSASCRNSPEATEWLSRLPAVIRELQARWSLTLGSPYDNDELSCAWVAPVTSADGSAAVLKVSMPHFEAMHEIDGLRFWNGDPTVRLIDDDEGFGAMLLERCTPGRHLRGLRQEGEQDAVIAGLLRRLWRSPSAQHPFRPLSSLIARWTVETLTCSAQWSDAWLVREGLSVFDELSRTAKDSVLLATDLHAGNVLEAQREPWLVIDPKPFFGDPAFDATQHLLNCVGRLRADPLGTIQRFAELLGVDPRRVQSWLFARLAAEPRSDWDRDESPRIARALAPS